ncbi:hypothetical protein F5Y01DRAFT_33719 [Xylaria sp. FL0043]|nr:hypothetical protein F5Y01DRAFT_33719 [Xylaria sp. FL0043]
MPIVPGTYWDLLDRTTPPVKRRATHAKARTGCLTCKRRKVKCDEAKPACARCVKSGHRCAGYEIPPQRKGADTADGDGGSRSRRHSADSRSTVVTHTLLRPKPGVSARSVDLVRASLTPSYLDVADALYFERFKSQVIADLGLWCGAEYWRHKILREVLTDKTVQHAALGAAAMLMDIEQQQYDACARKMSSSRSRTSLARGSPRVEEEGGLLQPATRPTPGAEEERERGEEGEEGEECDMDSLPPVTPLSNRSAHGKAALRHYTASISLCRQTLATEGITNVTARPSLTATFFYAVFELVQGNVGEADRILRHGVSLLDDALSPQQQTQQQTANDNDKQKQPAVIVADGELREIQLAFDRMRVTWGLCPYFSSASAQRGTLTHARHFELPSPDASVRTKQVFWNAFSSDFGQFMVDVQSLISSLSTPDEKRAALPSILAQRTHYLIQLRYWLPILEDLSAGDPGSAVLCTTKVYAQTAIIFLNCFLDPEELAYDAYEPIFADIVSTYERLLPSQHTSTTSTNTNTGTNTNTRTGTSTSTSTNTSTRTQTHTHRQGHLRFTLDTDLFHIITFTVSKCRAKPTRQRALRVFTTMTRRQALWTNSAMLLALYALASLEDKGRRPSDGFVPPEARYNYADSEWDFERRQMLAVFVPVVPNVVSNNVAGGGGGCGGASAGVVRVPINF